LDTDTDVNLNSKAETVVEAEAESETEAEAEAETEGYRARLGLQSRECGQRCEREWSGAWNRRDMQEVMRGLRGLRV
jgi:hypothetical protein